MWQKGRLAAQEHFGVLVLLRLKTSVTFSVCMYVCMYIKTYTHIYIYVYVIYMCIYVCVLRYFGAHIKSALGLFSRSTLPPTFLSPGPSAYQLSFSLVSLAWSHYDFLEIKETRLRDS